MRRPENFVLDNKHALAQGLVFAGLGGYPGSVKYRDSSPYDNHGTLTNMSSADDWVWSQDLGRMGLDFNGSDDYVSTPQIFNATTTGTVCAWIYANTLTSQRRIYSGGDYNGRLYLYQNNTVLTGYLGSGPAFTGGTLAALTWQHVALTWSGASATLYLNGKVGGTGTGAAAGNTYSTIGAYRDYSATAEYWNGQITDLLLYHSRVLSLPEIQQLADPSNVMLSGLILPPKRKYYGIPYIRSGYRYKLGRLLLQRT